MSGSHGEARDTGKPKEPRDGFARDKKGRKRTTEVGRALRSVYDDTLRENVPNDFLDLLGKLS